MAGGNAIRGTRVGSGPMGESERGESAPRHRVSYWCANGHESRPSFALEAEEPGPLPPSAGEAGGRESWDCPRCGLPAGRNEQAPPAPPRNEPYKTHLAY